MAFTDNIDKNAVQTVLNRSSFTGLMALYFLKIAHERSIGVMLKEVKEISNYPIDEQYAYGYLVACSAFKLIDFTYNSSIINVTDFNENLNNQIYSTLIERAKELDESKNAAFSRIQSIQKLNSHYKISPK